jgi:hypothetical protein
MVIMAKKTKPCVISCSVLKEEIQQLVKQGDLDVDLVFVSKYFHVDFNLIEKNLRQTITKVLPRSPNGIILVYGDLCLGLNNEMKTLADEYGLVKVDALNCVDCLFGGKGNSVEADPHHELMVLNPGMIGFFKKIKDEIKQEGIDESSLKQLFSGLKGIVLLDTLGESDKDRVEIEKMDTGLQILETKKIGLDKFRQLIFEAIEKSCQRTAQKQKSKKP